MTFPVCGAVAFLIALQVGVWVAVTHLASRNSRVARARKALRPNRKP